MGSLGEGGTPGSGGSTTAGERDPPHNYTRNLTEVRPLNLKELSGSETANLLVKLTMSVKAQERRERLPSPRSTRPML